MAKFMKNINLISRSAEQFREEKLAPFGIRGCQSHYVLEICRSPGITQEELSRRVFINKSNVARQVSLLEKGGFVRRESADGDRRARQLYPTEKMYAVLPEVQRVHSEWRELITVNFTDGERETLQQLSDKMVINARAYMENKE